MSRSIATLITELRSKSFICELFFALDLAKPHYRLNVLAAFWFKNSLLAILSHSGKRVLPHRAFYFVSFWSPLRCRRISLEKKAVKDNPKSPSGQRIGENRMLCLIRINYSGIQPRFSSPYQFALGVESIQTVKRDSMD